MRPYPKKTKSKKGWRYGSSGRGLASKHEALSSNPTTTKKKENKSKILGSIRPDTMEKTPRTLSRRASSFIKANVQRKGNFGVFNGFG
jgi:hypothetical protein